MMPDEWASIRSMARWVLPVLVGPSTAVTPWPRATGSREVTEEKEMGIRNPAGGTRRPRGCMLAQVRSKLGPGHAPFLYHNATPGTANSLPIPLRRTSLERIAAESLTRD